MKKLCIVGRGTVGCLAAAHFIKHTDWEIDWIFDPNIPTTSVGEGTTAVTPRHLSDTLGWTWEDIAEIGGTVKTGIHKTNWGGSGDYRHSFPSGFVGMHFSATDFQEKAFNQIIKNRRISLHHRSVSEPEELDADYVMVCTGSPCQATGDDFIHHNEIPVNSAYVTQCKWDRQRFTDTITMARPHGWVFGIPLQHRCSIGYIYNGDISSLEDVKSDLKLVLAELDLEASDETNHLKFNNYSRRCNFSSKVAYNGNASFFLEPLEATSTTTADIVSRFAWDVWNGRMPLDVAEVQYSSLIKDVKSMILLHYYAGSKFETKFWDMAQERADEHIFDLFRTRDFFAENCIMSMRGVFDDGIPDVGTWGRHSYKRNIEQLGISGHFEAMW